VSFSLVSASLLLGGCGDSFSRIDIVEANCGKCHNTDLVYMRKRSKAEWDRVVYGMKVRGLRISAQDEKILMNELNTKLGNGE